VFSVWQHHLKQTSGPVLGRVSGETYQGWMYSLVRTKPPSSRSKSSISAPHAFATTRLRARAPMERNMVTAMLCTRKLSSQNMNTLHTRPVLKVGPNRTARYTLGADLHPQMLVYGTAVGNCGFWNSCAMYKSLEMGPAARARGGVGAERAEHRRGKRGEGRGGGSTGQRQE